MSKLRNLYISPHRDLDVSINKQRNETGIKSSSVYNLAGNYRSSPSQFSGTKVFQRPDQERNYKYHLQLCIHCSNSVLAKSY